MKAYLVVTTINVPSIINDYFLNFKKYGHEQDVGVIIIGDLKSPDTQSQEISKKLKKSGFEVDYFDIPSQEKWLKKYPRLKQIIPYNKDGRRNIGFLMALEKKCDFLISIDDDSFPINSDYFAEHAIVGSTQTLPVVSSTNGWFNPCSMLTSKTKSTIYARGYPYNKRHQNPKISQKLKKVHIGVNAGLWLNEPDVDAITRLALPTKITGLKSKRKVLAKNCFAPINTQNTALVYDLIPAYYFVMMEGTVRNTPFDRFGDIWTGWFLKKISDHLGYAVSFGLPLTDHRRNKHNLFNDLYIELAPLTYNDAFIETLQAVSPKGKNCIDVYSDISKKFHDLAQKNSYFPDDFKKYASRLLEHQQIWLDAASKILR